MSRTMRKGKHDKYRDGGVSDCWYNHDSKEDRDTLNREFRNEEKQYFQKFEDTKYNQKPKSRGWKTH